MIEAKTLEERAALGDMILELAQQIRRGKEMLSQGDLGEFAQIDSASLTFTVRSNNPAFEDRPLFTISLREGSPE
jgi:hypothetical protein